MTIRRLLTLSLLFLGFAVCKAQESVFLEAFQYDQRIHDFGTILEKDGKVSHTFTFTNKSNEVVVINDVNAWCGCTTAQFSKEPVRPGKTTRVTLTYNPDHRPGKFSKEAVLMLNGGKYYTRIWVKGNVVGMNHPVTEDHPYAYGEGLYMSHQVLPFPAMKVGEEKTIRLLIANDTQSPMVIEFLRRPDHQVLQMPRRLELKPGERTKVYARYKAVKEYPYRRYINVVPRVNGKELKPLKIVWNSSPKPSNSKHQNP